MATKPYTDLATQLATLEERGMHLGTDAEQWLSVGSYYRLSGYYYVYRAQTGDGRSDDFVDGTSFAEVAALYEFDRKLRTLLFDGLERVEVALRRGIAEVVGQHDPLGYRDRARFRSAFDHARWLRTVEQRRLGRARSRDAAIKHHFDNYSGECPIWVVVDVLDFMDSSTLFEGMVIRDQFTIAESMGIVLDLDGLSRNQRRKVLSVHPMARWLEQATVARNICAHHGRLWNRGLAPASGTAMRTVEGLEALEPGQSESLFGLLCFVAAVLQKTSPGSQWAQKVADLIESELLVLPGRAPTELGAPEDWRDLSPWNR